MSLIREQYVKYVTSANTGTNKIRDSQDNVLKLIERLKLGRKRMRTRINL